MNNFFRDIERDVINDNYQRPIGPSLHSRITNNFDGMVEDQSHRAALEFQERFGGTYEGARSELMRRQTLYNN